jgi:hypothetical protein
MYVFVINLNVAAKKSLRKTVFLVVRKKNWMQLVVPE